MQIKKIANTSAKKILWYSPSAENNMGKDIKRYLLPIATETVDKTKNKAAVAVWKEG